MARSRNYCMHPKRVAFLWLLSLFLFFLAFRFLLNNSSSSYLDVPISNMMRRTRLYEKMAKDLDEHGPAFLKHGETSQSLSLSDLFSVKNGVVTPNLKAADPAVRANVLYLSTEYSIPISMAVKKIFAPYFDKAIWFQNSSLYHFSMFHASHHISPVPATHNEVESEANAVRSVAESMCPLKIILDRVVLTSTGVLLGCWQVTSGTDPATVRTKLRGALPHAPEKQLYDASILHTSFARLLGPPTIPNKEAGKASDNIKFFLKLVAQLNNQISGFQGFGDEHRNLNFLLMTRIICVLFEAIVSELWYVEEFDMLALALDGRLKVRRYQLSCSDTPET